MKAYGRVIEVVPHNEPEQLALRLPERPVFRGLAPRQMEFVFERITWMSYETIGIGIVNMRAMQALMLHGELPSAADTHVG